VSQNIIIFFLYHIFLVEYGMFFNIFLVYIDLSFQMFLPYSTSMHNLPKNKR